MGSAETLPQREALYGFILRRVRDPFLADDLAQETLARLLAYARTNKVGDTAALGFRIAANLITDHFRAGGVAPAGELDEEIACGRPSAEQVLMERQRTALFTRALEKMPPLRREVFIRRRLQGQSHREIAQAMGLSEAAVEKHVVRALEWLHQEVARAGKR